MDEDAELLRSPDPEAFGRFYARVASDAVTAYVARRVRRPDLTFDVVAETFARALKHRARYDPRPARRSPWCTVARFTARRRPTGAGIGCGAAPVAGSGSVAGGFGELGEGVLRLAIVTRRVAVVVLPGNRRVAPQADPRLPFGWRAAVRCEPSGRFDPTRPALETGSWSRAARRANGVACSARSTLGRDALPGQRGA